MANVRLEHVWKRLDSVIAVKDVSRETRAGDFLVLVGPGGCGRSTILRVIAGLRETTAGRSCSAVAAAARLVLPGVC